MKRVRRLRHWKQRFDKDAAFIWRTSKLFAGKMTEPGAPLDAEFVNNPRNRNKIRSLWEAGMIELAQFDQVVNVATGERQSQVDANTIDPKDLLVKEGNKWTVIGSDETFRTKKEALAHAETLPPADVEKSEDEDTEFPNDANPEEVEAILNGDTPFEGITTEEKEETSFLDD